MRRETAFSPESAAGSSEAGSYRSPFALLRGEAQIVCGVLEVAYYRAAGDGQAFPTRERYRVLDYVFIGNWTVLQIMSGDLG